jgi:hypothetical protein
MDCNAVLNNGYINNGLRSRDDDALLKLNNNMNVNMNIMNMNYNVNYTSVI